MNNLLEDQLTVLTDAHMRVIRWLERDGYRLLEEVQFPPYTVDIYIPVYHAAVEVDGPQHEARADRVRDDVLWDTYQLPVLHVPIILKVREVRWAVREFLLRWEDTAAQRWAETELRTPWL